MSVYKKEDIHQDNLNKIHESMATNKIKINFTKLMSLYRLKSDKIKWPKPIIVNVLV